MANKKDRKQDGEKRKLLFCSIFFLLSVGCVIFGSLVLARWRGRGVSRFSLWSWGVTLLVCLGYLYFLIALSRRWERIAKVLLAVYIFALFCLVFIYVLQKTGFSLVIRDKDALQRYLKRAGVWMPLLYVALQFLQVIILPIPSIVSTLAGVALFGSFWAFIYSFIGIVLGSFTAFYVGRKLGNKAVVWMVGQESLRKWRRRLKGKDDLFLSVMFLLPLFPDDILCFLAGLSTMSWGYFIGIIVFSRAIGISATCFSVDFIPFNTWWGISLWVFLAIFLTTVFVLLYKNLDKIQRKIDLLKQKQKNGK